MMGRSATSSSWFAAVAAAVVVYASLYPLTGWDHPAGWQFWRALQVPWSARSTQFDVVANVLGYLPLGLLATLALIRGSAWHAWVAMLAAVILASCLSLTMELLQNLLPRRVPSALDWVCNTAGAAAGAVLAWGLQRSGWIENWMSRHNAWFEPGAAGGTTLLVLWPLALLFPTPVPLGLGQVFESLSKGLVQALEGSALADPVSAWLGWPAAVAATGAVTRMAPALEAVLVAVGLLCPCCLAFAITRPGWRRVVLAVGAGVLAPSALTLSTALNFSPQHALTWSTDAATLGLLVGTALACAMAMLTPRVAAVLGIVAIVVSVTLGARAPTDPYFAVSLAAWEQGRFIRFHGAAQWLGWLWPYAALVYLMARVAVRPAGLEAQRRF